MLKDAYAVKLNTLDADNGFGSVPGFSISAMLGRCEQILPADHAVADVRLRPEAAS